MPLSRSCLRTFPIRAVSGPHSRPSQRSIRARSTDARNGLSPEVEMATSSGSRRTIAGAMKRHCAGRSTTLMRMPAASASAQLRRLTSKSSLASTTRRAPASSPVLSSLDGLTPTSAPAAGGAIEGVLEAHYLDSELAGRVIVEDAVGGVGVVVAAHAGVVAADDEMRAAIVAPHDGVEDSLLRAGITHPCRVRGEQHALGREVVAQELLVAAHAHRSRDIVALGLTDKRMEEQTVHRLQGHLLQVFMGAVDRVARLEPDHGLPPTRALGGADLRRREVVLR